jgi:hypothetical protein
MNNIIVNPEDNKQTALMIWNEFSHYTPSLPMIRDNCIEINTNLRDELVMSGFPCRTVYGLYKVDTFKDWLDEEDFTEEELDLIEKKFGDTYRDSLEAYVESLSKKEQAFYYYIPHMFILCDGLIIDAASDMFNKMVNEQNKFRYYSKKMIPICGVN